MPVMPHDPTLPHSGCEPSGLGVRRPSPATRLFDSTAAACGLLLLSPLLLTVAVLVKFSDGGPVFFRGRRVGRNERLFGLYKFRTMIPDADRQGPGITTHGDSRVTRVGRWLRRTKLDELPQLINVLTGDMALVGPRPEDPRYVELYTPEQRQLLSVRPGLTSAASLQYRGEEQLLRGEDWERRYREEVLPAKLTIDLDYLARRTFWTDCRLIVDTVLTLLRRG